MPLSKPDLDVCMLGHAALGEIGGVTRWAERIGRALPGLRVGATPVRDRAHDLPPARLYHALTPDVAAAVAPAARAARRPLVLTCHAVNAAWRPEGWRGPLGPDASNPHGTPPGHGGTPPGHGGDPPGRPPRRGLAGYAAPEVIVAVGEAVARSHVAAGAPADRMLVIPNGAPAPGAALARAAGPVVGFVGRLAPVKGIERLLEAVRMVRAELPARLVLVGPDDGPAGYGERLRRLAEAPGLRGAVTFAGPDRPERWYPHMACMALASESEGMPLALLEAMAHGVPCVAPDVGGCAEALGEAGVIVPPRDADALAGAILRLLEDRAEAARLARLGRERAGRWTEADCAAAYAEVYRRVLA